MDRCACSQAESVGVMERTRRTQPELRSLVPIESEPLIGETPHESLQSWLTPTPLFYVRNHFPIPDVDESTWNLTVEGCVLSLLTLKYSDFHCLPKQTVPVTLECAGNNRSDLSPRVPGNPFRSGAVSTAIWAGVPLSVVLQRAGIQPGAREVLFEGLDRGQAEPGNPVTPYLRSLPIDVAMHPDTLLAYEMNGEPLSIEHGYPLRLIVPGWYGMASVKWLGKISVIDYSFSGFFQTDRYVIEAGDGSTVPLTQMAVKSLISWPTNESVLPMREYTVTGLAWSGHGCITRVQFSDDGGATWRDADMIGPCYRYAWQQWSVAWKPQRSGQHTLMARAEDECGNVQPMKSRWNRLGYVVNGVKPVTVTVE